MKYPFVLHCFFLLLPALAAAQECDCCKIRTVGQTKYDNGDYAGAIKSWKNAQEKTSDAATKCSDLSTLITKAQKRINDANAARREREQAAREADDNAWDIAQGSLTGCQRYLQKYPNGRHATAARTCVTDNTDSDNDGFLNKNDGCPEVKGVAPDGCPVIPPKTVAPAASTDAIPSPVKHRKKSGLTLMPAEGGSYTMGSPATEANRRSDECQHAVTVRSFAIGVYEVTQADWTEVMGQNPSSFKNCDDCPVENVSWDDVQEFFKKANQKYGRKFRLPTKAEWEYAARGGKKSKGYQYAGTNNTADLYLYANFCDRTCTYGWAEKTQTDGYVNMAPVGSFRPNELGLYDMSGNVWEWCQNNYGPYPGCATPTDKADSRRVLRGGAWDLNINVCRAADRFRYSESGRDDINGFRLAQD